MNDITTQTVRTQRGNGKISNRHGFALEGLEPRKLFSTTLVVNSGQNIQDAINQAQPGDTILVNSGTYNQNLTFNRSGTWTAPITLRANEGANVTVQGYVAGGGTNIWVQGITVQNVRNQLQNNNAAVRTNTGWFLQNMVVQNNTGTGVGVFGNGVVLDHVTSINNGELGIGGDGTSNSKISNCTVAFNNRGTVNPPWAGQPFTEQINGKWFTTPVWEGGGGKWHNINNVLFTGDSFHDNGGPGLWFDGGNQNVWVMNSDFASNVGVDQDWEGMGMQVEINPGPFNIFGNTFHDNQASGLAVCESQHVDVAWNTFNNDGMELRAMGGRGIFLNDVHIHANRLINTQMGYSVHESVGSVDVHGNGYDNGNDLNSGRLIGELTGVVTGGNMPNWS